MYQTIENEKLKHVPIEFIRLKTKREISIVKIYY